MKDHKDGFEQLLFQKYGYNRSIRGIEIGCDKGEFCRYLLNKFANLHITTIDPSAKWEEVCENLKPFWDRVNILPVYSDDGYRFLEGKFDFVFIDGNHSYEQCKRDIEHYAPLVRLGGYVSGHNYDFINYNNETMGGGAHPGVNTAVNEIYTDKVRIQQDFIWYIIKE